MAALDAGDHSRIAESLVDILDRCDEGLIDGVEAAGRLVELSDQARLKAAGILGVKV